MGVGMEVGMGMVVVMGDVERIAGKPAPPWHPPGAAQCSCSAAACSALQSDLRCLRTLRTVMVPESLAFFFVASWLLFYRSGAQPQRSEVGQMRDAADAAVNVQWYAGQLRG